MFRSTSKSGCPKLHSFVPLPSFMLYSLMEGTTIHLFTKADNLGLILNLLPYSYPLFNPLASLVDLASKYVWVSPFLNITIIITPHVSHHLLLLKLLHSCPILPANMLLGLFSFLYTSQKEFERQILLLNFFCLKPFYSSLCSRNIGFYQFL